MKPTRTTWVYRADVRREFPDGVTEAKWKVAKREPVVTKRRKAKAAPAMEGK